MMKEPRVFNTRREAFWYRKGLSDALGSVTKEIKREIERYDLKWLDHLPDGGEDIKKGDKR